MGLTADERINRTLRLVVDDDPMILMHTCDILKEAGFRFFEASSGDEAKELLAIHAQSVVQLFSDVEMPGATNGFARDQVSSGGAFWIREAADRRLLSDPDVRATTEERRYLIGLGL